MEEDIITSAIKIVQGGGIIIYPTDTAFGIGCRIDNMSSVDRLFAIRKRPTNKPTPILVSSVDMALTYYSSPSDIVRRLMKKYWPGALTIVAPCHMEKVYSPLRGAGNAVGLRMPDHGTAVHIIEGVGVPIVGTSANFHKEKTPFTLSDLDPQLTKLVDLVVPGECKRREVSTVVDCTVEPLRILRQGAIRL